VFPERRGFWVAIIIFFIAYFIVTPKASWDRQPAHPWARASSVEMSTTSFAA